MSAQRRKSLLKINGDLKEHFWSLRKVGGNESRCFRCAYASSTGSFVEADKTLSPRSQRKLQALLTVGLEKLP